MLCYYGCDIIDSGGNDIPLDGKIVFSALKHGQEREQLFIMNPDGSGIRQVTHFENHRAIRPRWSPDGSQIVFQSDSLVTTLGLPMYIIDKDGSNIRAVYEEEGPQRMEQAIGSFPSWSPDGEYILFSRPTHFKQQRDIFTIHLRTEEWNRLTYEEGSEADWNPDGTKIVFRSRRHFDRDTRDDSFNDLYLMNPDGSDQRRITYSPKESTLSVPRWSPDGMKINFINYNYGVSNIYLHDLKTNTTTQITSDKLVGYQAWSPCGNYIIYGYRDINDEIGHRIIDIHGRIVMELNLLGKFEITYEFDWIK